jgi:hypothetical protein
MMPTSAKKYGDLLTINESKIASGNQGESRKRRVLGGIFDWPASDDLVLP